MPAADKGMTLGLIFACIALLSWGIGDFLIQRSTRRFGDAIALFFITAFASIILLPFVAGELWQLVLQNEVEALAVLLLATGLTLFAALFDFEALKIGKISVVEPVYAFEILVTAALGTALLREHLTASQVFWVFALVLGIFLVSLESFAHLRHVRIEKGVVYAVIATCAMGAVNFMFAVGARTTSPLLINWFTSFGIALVMLMYLLATKRWHMVRHHARHSRRLSLGVSVVDNMAWVAFAYSSLYLPVAIATSISEAYIALAALLGLVFNKEHLRGHQFAGLALCVMSAVILASTIL